MRVFIGWDYLEVEAFKVAAASLTRHSSIPVDISAIHMDTVYMYDRETLTIAPDRFDVISDSRMSTGHAIARFFIPLMTERKGWAVFMDGDVLVRADIAELIALADPKYAVQVVKHNYMPLEKTKKGFQTQTQYPCKNWSSVILWNLEHPAHDALTTEYLNSQKGLALHSFGWLEASQIGALPLEWNYLVGHSSHCADPKLVHFTTGMPYIAGHGDDEYAREWFEAAAVAEVEVLI